MKFSHLKDLISSITSWFRRHKRFWIMFLYEFLFVYSLILILMPYLLHTIERRPLIEVFIWGFTMFAYCSAIAGSYVALFLAYGTRLFWIMFIVLCLPAAYHLLLKSIWVFGISFFSGYMRGGMVSLNVETYKREYDQYNQGSFNPNYVGDRQVYADKKVEKAQKVYNEFLKSLEGKPTPCRLVKTPVRYWKIDLI